MVRSTFVGEWPHLPRRPVHQGNVVHRGFLWLGVQRDGLPVGRPSWAFFANLGSVAQVYHLAAVTRDCENIPQFVSARVLLKDDPLAVRRPSFAILPFV